MTRINLYKHGNAVGPRPSGPDDEIHGYRIVADEGKLLTSGGDFVYCADIAVNELEQWIEVEMHEL